MADYERIKRLGAGNFGEVWLVYDRAVDVQRAVKYVPRSRVTDPTNFYKEPQTLMALRHDHIVKVEDAGKTADGTLYVSMEYLPRGSVAEIFKGAPIRMSIAIKIITDVSWAVEYAHQKGYVHRDVKPENIMLQEDGRVVLMDFGIARGSDSTLAMTKTGRVIGTPYYMSPEQTKGQPVDHRTDIYSLGVVMYQMLTGYVPYDADSAIAVGIKHVSAPIPELPESLRFLQPIINTCLSKDPAHRFQSAAELIHVLEAIPEKMLDAAEAGAAAFRMTGRHHNAETFIINNALNNDAIPHFRVPTAERKSVSSTRIPTVTSKPARRRRGLLFVLLLVILSWAGYLKQEQLVGLWHNQIQPYLVQYNIFEAPASVIASDNATVEAGTPAAKANAVALTNNTRKQETSPKKDSPVSVPTPQERIQELRAELDTRPEQAVELAGLYRQWIRDEPDNPLPKQGLDELRTWYDETIREAFAAEDLPRARLLIEQMKTGLPRISGSEKFQRLEQRLTQAESVQSHLQQAKVYLAANAVVEPAGANALAELRAAQKLAPENPAIQQALQEIADMFLFKAKEYQTKGELEQAMSMTTEGLNIIVDDAALLALQQQLQAEKERQQYVMRQLKLANEQLKAGMLLTPSGNSAYDYYHAVLQRDPGNTAAKTGMKNIEQQLVYQATQNIEAGNFDTARAELDKASQLFSKTGAIRAAELKLSLAMEETLPKIQRIIFNESRLSSLNIPQTGKLQLGRTLYIGFDYQNFESETTLLQAILMDGTGRIQIAQKPVIISGTSGEHYFDIDLPVEGFSDGSYSLQLKLDNKQLIAGSFVVNKQAHP